MLAFLELLPAVNAHMDMSTMSSNAVPYGSLCMGILGTNYLFPGGNCTTSYRKAPCYCGDDDFVESVVSCIHQYSSNSADPNSTKTSAYESLLEMCDNLTISDISNYENNSNALTYYYGGSSGLKPGYWPVNGPFKLTDAELGHAVKAYTIPLDKMKKDTRYASALLAYWGAVILIKSLGHWLSILFPRAPLLWGRTRIGRLYSKWFKVHRYWMQMAVISGFCILTVLLTFCDVPFYSPDYSFRYSSSATYGHLIGSRTGVFSIYIMPLFFVFAGRNNVLQFLTGWTQEPFLVFHRYIARVEVALLFAHTIAFTIQRSMVQYYSHMWSEAYWNWGIAGLAFGAFIFVQAVRFIRRANYELFIVLHIVAAALFLLSGYYHIKLLEETNDLKLFYATFAIWGFDRAARLFRLIYTGPKNCHISLVDNDQNMLVLTLDKPSRWPMTIAPGTYVFVHFLTLSKFWQSHPLTLTTSCSDPTKMKLFFKVYSGISKYLAEEVLNATDCEKIETRVLLDGPYGISQDMLEYDRCVFIAGGSGITAPLAYVQNSVLKFPSRKFQKTTVHWAISNESALIWFAEELKFLQQDAEVDLHIYMSGKYLGNVVAGDVTEPSIACSSMKEIKTVCPISISDQRSNKSSMLEYHDRLSVPNIVKDSIERTNGDMCIFCCGPTRLHEETRNAVAKNLSRTNYFVEYFEEAYTW